MCSIAPTAEPGDRGDHPVHLGDDRPPKAVPLRHDTIVGLLDGVIGRSRGTAGEPARDAQPRAGLALALGGHLPGAVRVQLGVPVVLMEQFEPREFARLVREHGIRSSVLPPAAMVMLLQDPDVTSLEPLRYVRSVSAPLSPTHAREFHDRFGVGILNGYGQTELGGEVVGWSAADWKQFGAAKLGAVGRPHAGIEVRVHDDGELQVRSASARRRPTRRARRSRHRRRLVAHRRPRPDRRRRLRVDRRARQLDDQPRAG